MRKIILLMIVLIISSTTVSAEEQSKVVINVNNIPSTTNTMEYIVSGSLSDNVPYFTINGNPVMLDNGNRFNEKIVLNAYKPTQISFIIYDKYGLMTSRDEYVKYISTNEGGLSKIEESKITFQDKVLYFINDIIGYFSNLIFGESVKPLSSDVKYGEYSIIRTVNPIIDFSKYKQSGMFNIQIIDDNNKVIIDRNNVLCCEFKVEVSDTLKTNMVYNWKVREHEITNTMTVTSVYYVYREWSKVSSFEIY